MVRICASVRPAAVLAQRALQCGVEALVPERTAERLAVPGPKHPLEVADGLFLIRRQAEHFTHRPGRGPRVLPGLDPGNRTLAHRLADLGLEPL